MEGRGAPAGVGEARADRAPGGGAGRSPGAGAGLPIYPSKQKGQGVSPTPLPTYLLPTSPGQRRDEREHGDGDQVAHDGCSIAT